jgi:hypothetical protein
MSFLEWEVLIALLAFLFAIRRVLTLLGTHRSTDSGTLDDEELSGVKQLSAQLSNLYMLIALGIPSADASFSPDDPSNHAETYEALESWQKYAYCHHLSLGLSPCQAEEALFDVENKHREDLAKFTPERIRRGCYSFPKTCPECKAVIADVERNLAKAVAKLKAGEKVSSYELPMTISRCRRLMKAYSSASKETLEYMVKHPEIYD